MNDCGVCDPTNDQPAAIQAPAGANRIACKRHGTLGGAQFCVFCLRAHGDHLAVELDASRRFAAVRLAVVEATKEYWSASPFERSDSGDAYARLGIALDALDEFEAP